MFAAELLRDDDDDDDDDERMDDAVVVEAHSKAIERQKRQTTRQRMGRQSDKQTRLS